MDDEMEMNEKRVMTLDDWIRQSPLPRIEARMLCKGRRLQPCSINNAGSRSDSGRCFRTAREFGGASSEW